MTITSVNPATGRTLRTHTAHDKAAVETRLDRARRAFEDLRRTPIADRARWLEELGAGLEAAKDEFARLVTEEMGKPIGQSRAEIEKCAWACRYYADNAARFLKPEKRESGCTEGFVRFDPIGPILAIMPWNFPFWQVFRFAAPALAAGNVGVLKHSSVVPGCALAIEELIRSAGFPEGAFQSLLVDAGRAEALIGDPRIRAVTLTGSDAAGRRVARAAGEALKKVVLELGGSDPFVVLEDADIEKTIDGAVSGRTINAGQSCIAAKRFIVHRHRADEFAERFRDRMAGLVAGDPLDPATQIGPLAREDLVKELHRQVEASVRKGARVLCGGHPLKRAGFFYAPTVMAEVKPGMPVADEETFGPVAAVFAAADEEQAIALANQTRFGLGASVWTKDLERGKRLASRIDAGCVFINDFVKSDPRLPFGGVKDSGFGRELSVEGMREFVNVKTVCVMTP